VPPFRHAVAIGGPPGSGGTFNCFLTADGEGYVFTHGQVLNDLYVLDGLQF
jgi:hypothetical protein